MHTCLFCDELCNCGGDESCYGCSDCAIDDYENELLYSNDDDEDEDEETDD